MSGVNLSALGVDEPEQADDGEGREELARKLAKQLVAGKSREELLNLAGLVIRQRAEDHATESVAAPEGMPQTPDELWHYIVRRYGVRIARVSVCHDHDTPFDYICAGFFGWYPNVFGIGPRGGGKSYDQALLHDLNAHWKPGCVVADTPIDCPRDHRRFPLGVPISQVQPGQLIWTFNESDWIFELKPVVKAWVSKIDAPVYKVTLDDGSVIRATSNHPFLRRDGAWAELRELSPGDSLMPLYRDWEPYVRVRPDATRGGGMVREFDAVADVKWPDRKGMHVDHVDERRENSEPENLQLLTPAEHCSKTMKGRNVGFRRRKQQSEILSTLSDAERAERGQKISASLRTTLADREITDEQREAYAEGGRKGGAAPTPQIKVTCSCGREFWRLVGGHGRHLCPECKTEARTCPICAETYVVERKSRKRTCSRSCGQVLRHQERAGVFNHKIVSIDPDGSEDVWDIEVEGNHNFVTAGVVLHNSESATFGAVEGQAKRVYAAFKTFVDPEEIDGKMLMSETNYKPVDGMNYGSKVEVLGGTVAAVNSPHPQYPHSDEVEIMRADTWKESQPIDTMIPTPHGWRRFGDLEVGDLVFTRNGSITRVNKVVDYGESDVYEIALTDGRQTRACGDHLWLVAGTSQRNRGRWKVMRTDEIIAKGLKVMTGYRFAIPQAEPVDFHPSALSGLRIHPYVMGVVLGDGHIGRSNVDFASCDDHIAEKVAGLLPDRYVLSSRTTVPGKFARPDKVYKRYLIRGREVVHVGTMLDAFAGYGLAGARSQTKFIPEDYKIASRLERLELLRGLLDTDGSAIEGSSVAQYATTSERMARDVREVVFSLGGRAILRSKHYESEISSGMLYTLDISFSDGTMPFSLPRKMQRMTARQRTLHPSIKSIEPAGCAQVRCIGVEAPDATYLTNDFIVTHNSRNLAADKVTPDGRRIRGQNMATSTMKWKGGRVWQTLQKFLEAKKKAVERFGDNKELVDDMICKTAPFYVLTWCLFEVAEQVPNCRAAKENAHLPEWQEGLDRSECKCDCNEIVNGVREGKDEHGNPLPRTLESECQGRFYRSRGHRSRGEVVQLFMQNDERTWKAQQLCRETETEGLYLPNFSRQRHGLARFPLDVANGPIYSGTDWGFTDEAAVVWVQYLERPVEAIRYDGTTVVVPRGARVAISELTIARKTATELGQLAIMREVKLANVMSIARVPVRRRWADLQGAGDRRDWSKMGLKTAKYSTRNFDEHVKEWRGLVDADRFFVVVDEDSFTGMGCPYLVEQMEGWRADEKGNESRELPQHVVSGARYVVYGMHDVYQDSGAQSPEQVEAVKLSTGVESAPAAKPFAGVVVHSERSALASEADWRARI